MSRDWKQKGSWYYKWSDRSFLIWNATTGSGAFLETNNIFNKIFYTIENEGQMICK